jgi:hypothetical protein
MATPNNQIIEVIKHGNLQVAPVFLVEKSICSKCGKYYHGCSCSKYSENDVTENAEKGELVGAFWTKRSAYKL